MLTMPYTIQNYQCWIKKYSLVYSDAQSYKKEQQIRSYLFQMQTNTIKQSQMQEINSKMQTLLSDKIQLDQSNKMIHILIINSEKLTLDKINNQSSQESQLQKDYAYTFGKSISKYKPLQNVQPVNMRQEFNFSKQQIFSKLVREYGVEKVQRAIYSKVKLNKRHKETIQKASTRSRVDNVCRRKKRIQKNNQKSMVTKNLKPQTLSLRKKLASIFINSTKFLFEKPWDALKSMIIV